MGLCDNDFAAARPWSGGLIHALAIGVRFRPQAMKQDSPGTPEPRHRSMPRPFRAQQPRNNNSVWFVNPGSRPAQARSACLALPLGSLVPCLRHEQQQRIRHGWSSQTQGRSRRRREAPAGIGIGGRGPPYGIAIRIRLEYRPRQQGALYGSNNPGTSSDRGWRYGSFMCLHAALLAQRPWRVRNTKPICSR